MDEIETGGPAFPHKIEDAWEETYTAGMTLRDYFAAHAPIGVADANEAFYRTHGRNPRTSEMLDTLAGLRSMYADAMLKAREVK